MFSVRAASVALHLLNEALQAAAFGQRRAALDPGACLGPGKRQEVKARALAGECDTLIVDHEISPSQARGSI